MKNMFAAFAIAAMALSAPSFADEVSKQAKIVELIKITGVYDTIEQMRAEAIKRAEAQRPLYEKQLHDAFPEAPEDLWTLYGQAYDRYIESSRKAWSTKDAVDLYGKLYGAQLDEGDLDQILAYYRSPIGQKDVKATQVATPMWQAQLAQQYQGVAHTNLQAFLDDLKNMIRQCKAAQAAGSKTCETERDKT
jgi:hypothetical protein